MARELSMLRKFCCSACFSAWLVLSPQVASGQHQESSTRLLVGISLGSLRTSHPEGDGFAAGALLGLDRRIRAGSSLRAYATVTRGIINADDIALCHPTPEGCLADAVFPKWQFGFGLEGSLSPLPSWPIRVVGGFGVVLSTDPRERRGASSERGSESAGVWRLGLEVPFGASTRAPTVQLRRSGCHNRSMRRSRLQPEDRPPGAPASETPGSKTFCGLFERSAAALRFFIGD